MPAALETWLDRRIGLEIPSGDAACLLRERWSALHEQLPLLHGILFVGMAGLALATRPLSAAFVWPPVFLATWVAVRAGFWLRNRHQEYALAAIVEQMRRTFVLASLFFACTLAWNLFLCVKLTSAFSADMSAFSCIGGLAAAYALGNFPALSRVPLILVALPLAIVTSLAPDTGDAAIGGSLLVFSALTWRTLKMKDETFERLVLSRLKIDTEKRRAVRAERLALAEQSRVALIANSDPLTGLANRRGLLAALESMAPDRRRKLALVLIDLDGFKPVNDTFGHAAGDAILREVGSRLMAFGDGVVPPARLGGDEFALVLDTENPEDAMRRARSAIADLCRPVRLDDRTMRISACAGVSYQHETSVDEAMRRADLALYDAKRSGRSAVVLFSPDLQQEVQRRTAVEQALREPGLTDEFSLAFQPIFDLDTGLLTSFESLARWKHSELGWVSPSEFIPITEQISILEPISDKLLERAASVASQWPATVGLSFNLSGTQLCSGGTAARLLDIVRAKGLDPKRLQVEVTETAILADFDRARANLSALRAAGAKIFLDDFGAGFSSISYLREIAFDAVKLDGSLTALGRSGGETKLLRGVLGLCRAMGQECVAEQLETDEQVELMRQLGCRYGQGYVLGRPLDEDAARALAAPEVLPLRRKQAR